MSFERIPSELQALKQWIVWKYEDIGAAKPTKVPYNPHTGEKASVSDPNSWTNFADVCRLCFNYSGIGFVFTSADNYAGIDLDFTTDYEALKHQQVIFEKFDSYSERSPSGKGLHIIVKGKVLSGRRRSSVEIYSEGRFFTFTGDVFHDKPIAERQELLDVLWYEMGKGKIAASVYAGNPNETLSDAEVIQSCLSAVNGDKFRTLIEGQWANSYPSQSEADLAFFNFVAFYTQSRNQIARLFLASALGQRDKAKRHAYIDYNTNKAFDQLLPPVDIDGLQNGLEEAIARARKLPSSLAPIVSDNPYQNPPPGLLGEIAQFIYASSPRPVAEIALAASIALMAGICGRAYQVSGEGLNQYVLLLAQTGVGKEGMASGIGKIINTARTEVPSVRQFIGPAEIASGQALLKYLSKVSPCFVSIMGEFGLRLQQISSDRPTANDLTLRRVIMDLYHKSAAGKMLEPMIYSDKQNNTEDILSPAVTLLGESTPEEFYKAISTSQIASGFLPRFTTIEYNGPRPELNKHHVSIQPSNEMMNKVKTLTAYCLSLGVPGRVSYVHVKYMPDAEAYLDELNRTVDAEINNTNSDIVRHLWNRVHIKVLRLASCVAVGINPYVPTIELEHAIWARKLVEFDTRKLLKRFEDGEVGLDAEESKQVNEVIRVAKEYLLSGFEVVKKYDVEVNLHQARVIPYSYIQRRLMSLSAFRHDRIGATNALKRAISNLIETGKFREIGKNDLMQKYGTSSRCFMLDPSLLKI